MNHIGSRKLVSHVLTILKSIQKWQQRWPLVRNVESCIWMKMFDHFQLKKKRKKLFYYIYYITRIVTENIQLMLHSRYCKKFEKEKIIWFILLALFRNQITGRTYSKFQAPVYIVKQLRPESQLYWLFKHVSHPRLSFYSWLSKISFKPIPQKLAIGKVYRGRTP